MSFKAVALAVENLGLVPENGYQNNLVAVFTELAHSLGSENFKTASMIAQRFADTLRQADGNRLADAIENTFLDDSIDDAEYENLPELTVTVTRGKRQLTATAMHVADRWVILDVFDEQGHEEVLTLREKEDVLYLLENGQDETGR